MRWIRLSEVDDDGADGIDDDELDRVDDYGADEQMK